MNRGTGECIGRSEHYELRRSGRFLVADLRTPRPKTNTGHHARLGELIGRAVRSATREALRWQNGLEPSYTRSVVHALSRFGVDQTRLVAAIKARLETNNFTLLKRNLEAVLYEPQVAAAAYAFAAVWDRIRYACGWATPAIRREDGRKTCGAPAHW